MSAAMRARRVVVTSCALALLWAAPSGMSAQRPLDRKQVPAPGKTPPLRVPQWTKATLTNGAELVVSEKHDLPLVSFSLTFLGGANQFEAAGRQGLASLTASMLSEGTTAKDAEALSNALQLLGTSISASIGGESGTISFISTSAKFPATLQLLTDMLVNSTFPANALERLRGQRLVSLTQQKAQSGAIASRVFPRIVFGDAHPYGRVVTEGTMKAITREDVVGFHKAYFQPGRALVTVVGDVNATAVKPVIEKAFAAWPKGGDKPAFTYPAAPEPKATTIYLVDKPGAAQSTFALGRPGPARNTPDYHAIQVMNTMLGGMFQSRLNANLREEKGYSYGVTSGFGFGKGPGAFRTGGDIVTDKSDAALVEFMKELRGILGARAVTDAELATAKDALIQSLPATFASVSSINNALTTLWVQNLPDDYFQQYTQRVAAVTKDDVVRVANQYVTVDKLAIVIVGDRKAIEAPLKATNIAPLVYYDIEGNPAAK